MVKLAYLKFRPNSFSKHNNLGILYGNQIEGFIALQTKPSLKGFVWFIDSHQSTTDKDNRHSKYLQAAFSALQHFSNTSCILFNSILTHP